MMGKTDVKKIQNQRFNSMEHFGKVSKKKMVGQQQEEERGEER